MTDTVDLYFLTIVILIQSIIMLLNFILHSMRDESDKTSAPLIKNKQCIAYIGV